jgi:hypothetical protein
MSIDEIFEQIDVPRTDVATDVARGEKALRRRRRAGAGAAALAVAAVVAVATVSGLEVGRGSAPSPGPSTGGPSPTQSSNVERVERVEPVAVRPAATAEDAGRVRAANNAVVADILDPNGDHLAGSGTPTDVPGESAEAPYLSSGARFTWRNADGGEGTVSWGVWAGWGVASGSDGPVQDGQIVTSYQDLAGLRVIRAEYDGQVVYAYQRADGYVVTVSVTSADVPATLLVGVLRSDELTIAGDPAPLGMTTPGWGWRRFQSDFNQAVHRHLGPVGWEQRDASAGGDAGGLAGVLGRSWQKGPDAHGSATLQLGWPQGSAPVCDSAAYARCLLVRLDAGSVLVGYRLDGRGVVATYDGPARSVRFTMVTGPSDWPPARQLAAFVSDPAWQR